MEEQRLMAVQEHREGTSISELAEINGVSRKTIYKWLERYEGLSNVSRRPHRHNGRFHLGIYLAGYAMAGDGGQANCA